MTNLYITYEVSISTRYENMKAMQRAENGVVTGHSVIGNHHAREHTSSYKPYAQSLSFTVSEIWQDFGRKSPILS